MRVVSLNKYIVNEQKCMINNVGIRHIHIHEITVCNAHTGCTTVQISFPHVQPLPHNVTDVLHCYIMYLMIV